MIGDHLDIEPEQLQDGGVEIVDMDWILDGLEADFVRCAVDMPAIDSAAGHSCGEFIKRNIQPTPFFPASGPATDSFNGLHPKSKFLAAWFAEMEGVIRGKNRSRRTRFFERSAFILNAM